MKIRNKLPKRLLNSNIAEIVTLSVILLAASLYLYSFVFKYYFFQDDWFHLNISNANSRQEFIRFFSFRTDIIAWRPISKQLFFFLIIKFLNYNSYIAHLIIFAFHMLNSYLVYIIIARISHNKFHGFISAFLYSTATFNFTTLAWISAGEYTIGVFFYLLSSLIFLLFLSNRKTKYYIFAIITFILSLASTELSITWPAFIIFILLVSSKKLPSVKNYIFLMPSLIFISCYVVLRIFIFPAPFKEDYQINVGLAALKNTVWYLIWVFNIPEDIKNMVKLIPFSLSTEPTFYTIVKGYLTVIIGYLLVFFLSLAFVSRYSINKKTGIVFIYAVLFTILGLLPVIVLPKHSFSHYLIISSIGVYFFIGLLVANFYSQKKGTIVGIILPALIIISWYLSSRESLSYTKKTSWIPGEQAVSSLITQKIKKDFSNIPKNSVIDIDTANDQAKHAMMDQDGLKVILNDNTVSTNYTQLSHDLVYTIHITLEKNQNK